VSFVIKSRGASSGLVLLEFLCPEHGRFEELVDRASPPDAVPCECGASSPWTISAPATKIQKGALSQGSFEKPEYKGQLDTRALADGMPYNEWKAKRDKYRKEQALKRNRAKHA